MRDWDFGPFLFFFVFKKFLEDDLMNDSLRIALIAATLMVLMLVAAAILQECVHVEVDATNTKTESTSVSNAVADTPVSALEPLKEPFIESTNESTEDSESAEIRACSGSESVVETPKCYTDEDAEILAKMLWGEARGVDELVVDDENTVSGKCQRAAVVWTVLNRVDAGFGTIVEVVTAPRQYYGYDPLHPIDTDILELVYDVLDRWDCEKKGGKDVGRVLPSDYLWFRGNGEYNYFRNEYRSNTYWNWELEDPYKELY